MALLVMLLVAMAGVRGEEVMVRLRGGDKLEGGMVQVWRDGAWGHLCDGGQRSFDQAAGDLVCQELGFARALVGKVYHGDTQPGVRVPRGARMLTTGISCKPGATSLSECNFQWGRGCSNSYAVSLICQPQSRSACGQVCPILISSTNMFCPGSHGFPWLLLQDIRQPGQLHGCPETVRQVGIEGCLNVQLIVPTDFRIKSGANLVEITSALENQLVGRLVEVDKQRSFAYWTGGVVNRVAETTQKFWHGSQNQMGFDNDVNIRGAEEQPKAIIIQNKEEVLTSPWATEDFEEEHNFICEFPPDDIGCLRDGDDFGKTYSGVAASDRDGTTCLPWKDTEPDLGWNHNFCRNHDGDESPWCYIGSEEPSYCTVPKCSMIKPSPTPPAQCSAPKPTDEDPCFKVRLNLIESVQTRHGCHRRSLRVEAQSSVSPRSMFAMERRTV